MSQPLPTPASARYAGVTVTGQQRQAIVAAFNRGLTRAATAQALRDVGLGLREAAVRAVYNEALGVRESGAVLQATNGALIPPPQAFSEVTYRMGQNYRVSGVIELVDGQGNVTDRFYGFHSFDRMTTVGVMRAELTAKIQANIQNSPPPGTATRMRFLGGEMNSEQDLFA